MNGWTIRGRWDDSFRAPTSDAEGLMIPTHVPPVLVTGATGRVGRVVIDLLIDAGVPVRALTHRADAVATLPANVEVVTGDLTVPESLDAGLRGVESVLLVWTAPEGCTYSDRGPDQGFPSGPVRLVRNPDTCSHDGLMDPCCDPGVRHGAVSPDNVHETGFSPGGQSGSPIVAADPDQVERTRRKTWSPA